MFSKRTAWQLTPNRFTQVQHELRDAGRAFLDLTSSNPTRSGFLYDKQAILESLSNPLALDYDPHPKGLISARRAVADYYREDHGTVVDPESIVLTSSTSEGYSYVLRLLCDAGDEILVPKPSYPLFEFLADLEDVKLIPYPLIYDHGWQIDLHALEQNISGRTRAIVFVHPNNPTGSFVRHSERNHLNNLCRTRQLALIVDEVFLDYALDGRGRDTFTGNRGTLTFALSGLSKISGLPQLKLAWIIVSGPEEDTALNRLEIIADTYLSVGTPILLGAGPLLGQRKSIQPQILARVTANLAELDHQLACQKHCARLDLEGGWYATLRVPAIQPDEDLAIEILQQTSVLVHPGHFYDFAEQGHLVLSLITPEKDFREGISRVLQVVEQVNSSAT